jgi:hypothetical protein
METAITEFMNTRRFTNLNFTHLRSASTCNLLLTITEQPAPDRFKGTLQVIYAPPGLRLGLQQPGVRPAGQHTSSSVPGEHADRVHPERFTNNLAVRARLLRLLHPWCGRDTYQSNGGTDFYTHRAAVVNNAQNASEPGWKAFEDQKNRYWLIDNQLQAVFRPLRELLYELPPDRHLDSHEHEDVVAARKACAAAIEKLKTVHQAKPASYNLQVFFNAKVQRDSWNSSKPADPAEKAKLFNTLQIIDPGHISKYQAMMRGNR